jgi:hypothetical protein
MAVSATDLLTPPGIIHAVQGATTSLVSMIPPPAPPVPGTPAAAVAGVPAAVNPLTPLFATGLSNLVARPPVSLPPIPGLPVPMPAGLPVPSDLLCAGTDWSASQGDSAAQPAANSAIPRALITGTQPGTDRRDRWG